MTTMNKSLFLFCLVFVNLWSCGPQTVSRDESLTQDGWRGLAVPPNPCRTRYPVLLIHGIGVRDRFLGANYFGRVPQHLIDNCQVEVFYGNHDAFGTFDNNANKIMDSIIEITDRKGFEKVNIIAHSKGGIDVRFMFHKTTKIMIGGRLIKDRVASFTTLSTPHRGSVLADFLFESLSDGAEKFLEPILKAFGRIQGDSDQADARKALSSLQTVPMTELNQQMNDLETGIEGIYSQSWAGLISGVITDPVFQFTHTLMKRSGSVEDSDGAVQISSAQYGLFRGTVGSGYWGGVSHLAMVDKAQVFSSGFTPGFDPRLFYNKILQDLKQKGF